MMKNLIITIIILSLLAILYVSLSLLNKNDLSTQKAATCNLKVKGPVYLITYADGDVYEANQKALGESALNNCIDIVYMYGKRHLDEAFVQKNKKILEAPRGAGYWLWKPYLIKQTLDTIPEGSIVMYLDSGIKILNPLDKFLNHLQTTDIVLVENYSFKNKHYIKRDLLRIMDMDNEEVRNAQHLNAAMFAVRNTPIARNFIQQWLEIGELEGAIDNTPSKEEYPELIEHRHDQSILSLLYLQNPNTIKGVPAEEEMINVWHHRRRSMNQSLYISKTGNPPQRTIIEDKLYELLKVVKKNFM